MVLGDAPVSGVLEGCIAEDELLVGGGVDVVNIASFQQASLATSQYIAT